MSGIAGIIHFDGAPVAPGEIGKMTTALAHRGPDGISHWVKGSVALGQCMLHTTPESLEESQPLTNEDESLALVMDGRVDNWQELRRELLSLNSLLRDRSDAELVLRAYELWGRYCLQKIDGDFALVIWDARRQEAFCARDRMGNKPFNYHWNGKTLVFASELHAILALPWVPQQLNEGMLVEYLVSEWHTRDETLWLGILRLVAAHTLVATREGLADSSYWQPRLDTPLVYRKDEDYFEHYREVFVDSVRRLSRSHLALACEVSGGLDSSAVFCIAAQLLRGDRLRAPGVEGFTLAFEGDSPANELAFARAAGAHVGMPIHEIPPTIAPPQWYSNRAHTNRDFPWYPNGIMLSGLIRAAQARGSRVILNGAGGDEWLEGTRMYYAEELSHRRWGALWQCYRADVRAFGKGQATSWLIRHGLLTNLPAPVKSALRSMVTKTRERDPDEFSWLAPPMRENICQRRVLGAATSDDINATPVQRYLLDMLNRSPQRELVSEETDRFYAAHGIEVRSPLNAAAVVQCAVSMPERMRLRGNRSKFVHVGALPGDLPQAILQRPDKAEFGVVVRQNLDAMGPGFFAAMAEQHPDWVLREGVASLFRDYQAGRGSGWPLWYLWGLFGCDRVATGTQSPSQPGNAGCLADVFDDARSAM